MHLFIYFFLFYPHQDVSDLFGADLPVEGGEGGQFAWRDGPLLQALKAGHWVVLDEVSPGWLLNTYIKRWKLPAEIDVKNCTFHTSLWSHFELVLHELTLLDVKRVTKVWKERLTTQVTIMASHQIKPHNHNFMKFTQKRLYPCLVSQCARSIGLRLNAMKYNMSCLISVESCLTVSVGRFECLFGSSSWGVCTRTRNDIHCPAWEDKTVCLPEPPQPGWRQEGATKILPQQIHTGNVLYHQMSL